MPVEITKSNNIIGFLQPGSLAESYHIDGRLQNWMSTENKSIVKKTSNKEVSLLATCSNDKIQTLLVKKEQQAKFSNYFYRRFILRRHYKQLQIFTLCEKNDIPLVNQQAVFFMKRNNQWELVLISDGKNNCNNLAVIARDYHEQFKSLLEKAILNKIVAKIADMHKACIAHKDLKWSNLLIDSDNNFYFVDTDHISLVGCIKQKTIFTNDFARFIVGAYEAKNKEIMILELIGQYAMLMSIEKKLFQKQLSTSVRKLLIRKNIRSTIFDC